MFEKPPTSIVEDSSEKPSKQIINDVESVGGKRILTGIRPTATLTIANLIGAAFPLLELQKLNQENEILAFVATLHGLTDHEPEQLKVADIVKDYIALGLDPSKIVIFDQYELRREVALLKLYLERHITIARVSRVPTLKDKLKEGQTPEQANVLLMAYPIMMAVDILLQDAQIVPVGKDQFSHMEVARELADAFNNKYGNDKKILVRPETMNVNEPVNILSLAGEGKMSKSKPEGAIFLTDTPDNIVRKMKRAETAIEGQASEKLDSLVSVIKALAPDRGAEIDELITQHLDSKKVMGKFKMLAADIIIEFTTSFQKKREQISDEQVKKILENGISVARANANEVLKRVEEAMKFAE